MAKNFIYFVDKSRFTISDREFCALSENTIDLQFFDMANNRKLLDVLHLYYMNGNYGVTYTFNSRAEWFCGYISAFSNETERSEGMRQKLMTNPVVRLLFMDEELLQNVKAILTVKKNDNCKQYA